jgi:protein-S-isoprenylcysteine O-methyltransferase Ste14
MPMSIKDHPELVIQGPYVYVRHPIYTGIIFAMLGSALALGLWWLIFGIVMFLYFIYSAVKEEKTMIREFPNEYPAYKKRTKMLIPFVF